MFLFLTLSGFRVYEVSLVFCGCKVFVCVTGEWKVNFKFMFLDHQTEKSAYIPCLCTTEALCSSLCLAQD
jgi:hypothetical protein